MHILASGPELQAVRFGYVILGKMLNKKCNKRVLTRSFLAALDHTTGQ
jgi:hypothetical protein